jgi:hypothetical protein
VTPALVPGVFLSDDDDNHNLYCAAKGCSQKLYCAAKECAQNLYCAAKERSKPVLRCKGVRSPLVERQLPWRQLDTTITSWPQDDAFVSLSLIVPLYLW